ncbi:MAG TPA: cupin-like domain-containing protein [Usitatibacter sp.]|nr:cupin-like domain-containing protein [Usitatibacter sp.]
MRAIADREGVGAGEFATEVAPARRPVVLRGAVAKWPAVAAGRESAPALAEYLARFDNGREVDAIRMPPSARGRIFYNEDLSGFNFIREKMSVSEAVKRAMKNARFGNSPALAVQSAPIPECLPGFAAENVLELVDAAVVPRIWIGNGVVTPAHFDESSNIACVVAGRRRFTLFPPEQIANLYIGPLGNAPTGTPISLVSFREPDPERFPRFREALEHAQVADMEPGDAIFIPPLWWHHVESLEPLNMLVNYWWKGNPLEPSVLPSALDSLLHAIVGLRSLSPGEREAWRAIFEYYVFGDTQAASGHIPEARRGVLGDMSPEFRKSVRDFLVEQLKR